MNHRTKSLWLPALASFGCASLFLLGLTEISRQPEFLVQLNSGFGRSAYVAWMVAQLLFGAIGAFLSRRAGGNRRERFVAGIFPAMVMFALLAVWIPISAVVERNAFVLNHPNALLLPIFLWAVAPAIMLLLGAVPFLGKSNDSGSAQMC